MDSIELKAYAKINLGLDVLRRREDGYHDVKMVMQAVGLHDTVRLQKTEEEGIFLRCSNETLPADSGNLAYKAVHMLKEEFSLSDGVSIGLEKRIPIAAGLAGGSTDAAAALKGMNELFALGLSEEELMERGVRIGADVPFCIMGGTALSEGIGERLTRLPQMPDCYILLAKPPISVSTKEVYENLVLNEEVKHPDIEGIIEGIRLSDVKKMSGCLGNLLESVTEPAYPVILDLKQRMIEAGALGALMSGSGPTVFGIFDSLESAKKAEEEIRSSGLAEGVFLTNPH